jgi:protein pelota
VERVKNNGAQVLVFSSLHPSGEQLTNLTGIAAILHFPVDFEEE